MEEDEMVSLIQDVLFECGDIKAIHTFEDVGMVTNDSGLVVVMRDKSEFQITVVKSW
jgi:hypothetical protein